MIATKSHNTPIILQLDQVSYRVSDGDLVSGVSMNIHAGEMISLIGPNGAGKSTLVKLILGLLTPTQGKITKKVRHISYVPQRFSIPNILPLRAIDLLRQANPKRLTQAQKDDIFDKLSITSLLPKQMHHLSGGETQRVLLARALLDKPELLILDEPMQGLHDLHWVMKGSRRVICLNKHICCQGVPSQIAIAPEFVQLFGYQAPYIHQHTHCNHHLDHEHIESGHRHRDTA